MLYYVAMLITIFSNLLYHISQKTIKTSAHPLISLMVTYFIALILCFMLLPFFPIKTSFISEFRQLNFSSYLLGLAIIGLEIGFLLAYRSGWNISYAAVVSNVALGLLLIPIGLIFFKDRLSVYNYVGVFFAIIGLILISLKK